MAKIRKSIARMTVRLAGTMRLAEALKRWPFIYRYLRKVLLADDLTGINIHPITKGPLKGFKIALGPKDRLGYLINSHEPETVRLFISLCRPEMFVLDAGAHVGYFSLLASTIVGSRGRVYTAEPNPKNIEKIRLTIANNGCTNICLLPVALSDTTSEVNFAMEDTGQMGHIIANGDCIETHAVVVNAEPFDNIAHRLDIVRLDLIKMDVEGSESSVLRGMRETLGKFQPLIVCEWHPATAGKDYQSVFSLLGYNCQLLSPASEFEPFHILAGPAKA
jgi:FkbM family methyltransferase